MNRENMQREVSLLPRMSPEEQLQRIQKYYSFIGNISDPQIDAQNLQILSFAKSAKKMLEF